MNSFPRDIVFCALSQWGRIPYWRWRSLFQAVSREGHRILWVDQFSSWGKREMLAYLSSDPRRFVGHLSDEQHGIRVLTSPLRIPRHDGRLADAAIARAVQSIKQALRQCDFEAPLLWTSAPSAEALVGQIGETAVLYDCLDDLRSLGADAAMLEREARLEAKADLVLTCMPSVQELKLATSRRVACVPNGVDAAHFRTAAGPGPVPRRLVGLRHPIIGYAGVIYDRIDWDLVATLSSMRPDWSLVFVGLIQQPPPRAVANLQNVHFLGPVAFEDLPDHYRAFDVCWVPHHVNTLTERQSSLKVLEYVAAGRPVVTTDIPLPLDLEPLVHVVRSASEIAQVLETAMSHDSEGEKRTRCEIAALHSWDVSFQLIKDAVIDVLAVPTSDSTGGSLK